MAQTIKCLVLNQTQLNSIEHTCNLIEFGNQTQSDLACELGGKTRPFTSELI